MSQFFKDHRALLLAALVSACLIPLIWKYAMLSDVPKLEKSRSEILEIGRAYAKRLGFKTDGFGEWIYPETDRSLIAQLRTKYSHLQTREIIEQGRVDVPAWEIVWEVKQQRFRPPKAITLTASGKIVDMKRHFYERQFFDTTSASPIPLDSAKILAIAFLKKEHGLDVQDTSRFTFIGAKSGTEGIFGLVKSIEDSLIVQTFAWNDKSQVEEIGLKKITVGLVGVTVKSFSHKLVITDSAKKNSGEEIWAAWLRGTLPGFLKTFMMILLLVIFLKKYHDGEVGVRGGVSLFLIVLSLHMLWLLGRDAPYLRRLTQNFFDPLSFSIDFILLFMELAFAIVAFLAWTISESDARFNKRETQILGIDALLQKQFFSKTVGREILVGASFGLIACLLTLLYISTLNNFFPTTTDTSVVTAYASAFPLMPVWELSTVISANVLIRLFVFERLLKKFKREWIAIVATGALWAVYYHTFPTVYPLWGMFIGSILIGVALSAFSARHGLLAVIAAEFMYHFTLTTFPLLLSPSSEFWGAGVTNLSVVVGIILFATIAISRGSGFSFKGSALPSHVQRISQRARMEEELKIACETQRRLLPQRDPSVKGLDISGICLPALEVGGDYYDYMQLGNENLAIAIGDVSGKGVPAAMYMTLVKGVIQFASSVITEPKRALVETNRLVFQTFKRGTFVSMIYAVIDVKERTLRYVRAGHNPLLHVSRSSEAGVAPMPKGMAMGLAESQMFEKTLEETIVALQSGDTLVFYTDGFSEAKNEQGEEYGEARLLNALRTFANKPTASEVVQAICKDVQRFARVAPQHDDMTMVVVRVL